MGDAKKNKPKKRAAAAFGDIFHYSNQIDFKFGSSFNPSTANAIKTHILNDSSSSEDEEFELLSKQRRSWKKNDDSVVLSDDESSEDDEEDKDNSQPLNDSQDLAPSPPPPPKLDTPTLARQTCRARASKQSREVESTLFLLKQTTEVQSPSTLSFTSPTSGSTILVEEDSSPFIPQRSSDRNMVVKVRTRSGVQRFNMKAGDPFSKIVPDISRKENIPEENILLTLRDEGIVMSESPLSLGVTVADILECIVAQSGSPTEESEDDEDTIEVKIQGGDSKQIKTFRIKMNDPLEKLMTKYCSSMNLPRPNVHFSFDGDEIASTETPEDLDMEDGNMIDVKVK